jgi:hypothetical protein
VTKGDIESLLSALFIVGVIMLFPVAWEVWQKSRSKQEPSTDKGRSENAQQPAYNLSATAAKMNNWYPDEDPHQAAERRYWNKSVVFTAVAAALSSISAIVALGAFVNSQYAVDVARENVREAHRQADQAERQADVAKEIGQIQLRAFVFLGTRNILIDDATRRVGLYFETKNTGLTPASELSQSMCIAIREWPLVGILGGTNKLTIAKSTLAPGGVFTRLGAPFCDEAQPEREMVLSPEDREAVRTGHKAIYVYGRIDYKDVFGEQRWTNYRVFFNDTLGKGNVADDGSGNDWK